jgi:ligand-binding sensor domain-containing protein
MSITPTKFYAVIFAVFSFCGSVNAQLIELPDLELITEKEGLPFNSIQDIVSDNKGFLWVASNNSLARFDGYSFLEVPGNESDSSISGSIIGSLSKDTRGMLWVGCLKGRVFRLDPETLATSFFQLGDQSSSPLFTEVFGDREGNVWAYVETIGLYKLNGTKFDFIGTLFNLPEKGLAVPSFYNRVAGFYDEDPGALWLASSNGLYKVDTRTLKITHLSSLSPDVNHPAFLHQIVSDGQNGFWCSSYGTGLIHVDKRTGKYERYLFESGSPGTANIIYGIARKSEHELWISSSGLGVFNEVTKKFSFYYDRQDLNSSLATNTMITGKDGIIWMVADKGLLRYAPGQSKFMFKKIKVTRTDNRGFYSVSEVLDDQQTGRRIIGTRFADGLHVFDSTGEETIIPFPVHPQAEAHLIVNDLIKDRDGKILVLTRDQLYELTSNNKLVKINGPNELLPSQTLPHFYRIMQSSSGDYWIASSRSGLFQYSRKQNRWRLFTDEIPNTIASKRVFAVEEDVDHKIWAAHPRHGLSIFDPATEKWSYLRHKSGDTTGLVSDVYTDFDQSVQGKMIFSTLEGISVIDSRTKSIRNIIDKTDLSNRLVFTAQADDAGNIWAVTNRGLIVLSAEGKLVNEFKVMDGLKGAYPSFVIKKHGNEMYIFTAQGFYSFYPAQALQEIENKAPLYITGVRNQKTDLLGFKAPSSVRIDYSSNALSIKFSLLNFSGTQRNKYRFKMEGLDKNWIETFSNEVNYSGIPSGDYTFMVQSADGRAEASIPVSVSTPLWKQRWARLLVALVGLGLIYILYRMRLNQIRKEEKLKREFNQRLAEVEMKALKAQMSPHFIFNSLNSINRYIVKSEPEKASLYLTKFSKLIRLILDNSNEKIVSLDQELTSLKLYVELEALRFNDKFSYSLSVSDDLNPHSVGVPPMIIQPFVENAIWHGLLHQEKPGLLNLSISRFGHGLQCVIEDNGVGRKKAGELKSKSVNKEKSYGMKITSDRLSMLNGESKISSVEIIDLEDEQGSATGTRVIVKIMSAELEPEF